MFNDFKCNDSQGHCIGSVFFLHKSSNPRLVTTPCRCGIPVVIMGETGCGKTRLIRFMCDMAARRVPDDQQESANLVILKVCHISLHFLEYKLLGNLINVCSSVAHCDTSKQFHCHGF